MTIEDIKRIDPVGMFERIKEFPQQVKEAIRIGRSSRVRINTGGVRNIVLTGLGGSAIGGDLLRTYLAEELSIPFLVNRHYVLPQFVDRSSLVIVSSYSGNTEETIEAHKDAIKRKAKILCITTGGETDQLAKRYKQPVVKIPTGLQPRAALGYSFFPLLQVLSASGFIRKKEREIKETGAVLERVASVFGDPTSPENEPLGLAHKLKGKLPVIYSSTEHLDAVNLRWRGQIAENAKQLAFGNLLPEMNHNELVGWKVLVELMNQCQVVLLRDKGTHTRVTKREEITKQIIAKYSADVHEVWSEGESLLARMFYLVHFGDWVSFYLAVLNNEDPTPVRVIDYLKSELAKV